jgi:adenine-specific DNA-methyltransferase
MNYIGSKLSLLDFIEKSIEKITTGTEKSFCDIFAGTGAVGAHFKKKGYSITANDLQYYSYVLNRHYIGTHKQLNFSGLNDIVPNLNTASEDKNKIVCEYLSNLDGIKGFIYYNYCVGDNNENTDARLYFSNANGKHCDAARQKIENWYVKNKINEDEYYFLLTSILESIDKYANTTSVYGAYLKKLKKSAQQNLEIKPAALIENNQEHIVLNGNANEVISDVNSEILYLDPPYNHRQYASNYHVLETIARYDNPKLYGKTGLREYQDQKSEYCSRTQVKLAFSDLISKSKSKYIFMSYNNEGLLSSDDIKLIMSEYGEYGVFTYEYRRYKADIEENRNIGGNSTTEYLHYLVKND